jgi:hypothetical protein
LYPSRLFFCALSGLRSLISSVLALKRAKTASLRSNVPAGAAVDKIPSADLMGALDKGKTKSSQVARFFAILLV